MSQDVGLFLESNRTNAVGTVNVAATRRYENPAIELNPTTPGVSVGGGWSSSTGEIRLEHKGVTGGRLWTTGGVGRLKLKSGGRRAVDLAARDDSDPKGQVRLFADNSLATEFTHSTDGGRLTLYDAMRDTPLVVGEAAPRQHASSVTGGRLVVNNAQGDSTCTLLGRDGACILTGFHDREDTSRPNDAYETSGSDLRLQSRTDSSGGTDPEDSGHDIHVHMQGDRDDDAIVNVNTPRIRFDGPNATLELGRGSVDENRAGVEGSLGIFHKQGLQVLGLGVSNGGGEVVFRQGGSDDSSSSQLVRIVADPDGLAIHDTADQKVFLITNRGEVKTKGTIDNRGF